MSHPEPNITFTQNAVNKVYDLLCEEENCRLNLRVYIEGGGCSGFQYGFTFDEVINADDFIVEKKADKAPNTDEAEVRLVLDPLSYQYLMGAEIDYEEDIQAQFVIRNPNAKTTCGCGSSFSA